MNYLRLLIDDVAQAEISHLAIKFGNSRTIVNDGGLKVTIPIGLFGISFYQAERYERYVSCSFDFDDDCSFRFETVRAAVNEKDNESIKVYVAPIGSDEMVVRRTNSDYVKCAVKFFEDHSKALRELPPSWFPVACEVEKKDLSERFPEIALYEFQRKTNLWNKWRLDGCGL